MGGFLLPCCVASGALSLCAPACHFGPFLAPLLECPFLSLALPLPVPLPFPPWWWWGGVGACGAPMAPRLGVGGLEPLAEGLGGVGGRRPWTAPRRRASHAVCGMVASGAASLGWTGVRVRIYSKMCTVCTPSHLPAPPAHFIQRRSSRNAGADNQARWAGAWGGEGSELEVLEWRERDVDMRRWRAWWRLGVRERGWRGLGVEDGYGRQGEREARWGLWGEGEVDMGRRWRACRRLGQRERRWRGLGVEDAYGRWEEREAWWGSWGGAEVEMGRQWRAWWRPGEQERRERGPGGSLWRLGERERRE